MSGETTFRIQNCLERMRDGDASAQDELIRQAMARLERLSRKLYADFPGLQRWVGSDDVLQGAYMRLSRALAASAPDSPRAFFRLAALQMRRELIDLARHYRGPEGAAANHASRGSDQPTPQHRVESTFDPAGLVEWAEFHEAVANLPDEEREVAELLWYHDLSQQEAAEVIGTSLRTVKRRWQAARLALHARLKFDAGSSAGGSV